MPLKCRKCKDTGQITTWEQYQPFNPNSPGAEGQVARLIRYHGLKLPKKRGENRETTEAKYLRRFGKRFPVFAKVLKYRQYNKLKSNYLWKLDANNSVRGTLGWHPSTWRKSMRGPNLQVIPKPLTDITKAVRETIVAPPGWLLVEADSEGIEAVLVAYDAGDPEFMRICKAGPHGFFMSHVLNQPIDPNLPFAELKAAIKSFKKRDEALYDRCKRTIHGTHYGLTPFGMNDEYEEQFPSLKIATEFQNRYLEVAPAVKQWMDRTRRQAHDQRYLDNHFQYRHYFYNVFTWDRRRDTWVLGEDGKRCIAFKPQSDASAMQSEYLLTMDERGEQGDQLYAYMMDWLRLLIHDSFVWLIPRSEEAYVPQAAATVMNMPFAELGGLRIGVEVKVGEDLLNQSTVPVELIV